MATVEKRISEVMAVYGPLLNVEKMPEDGAEALRLALRFAIELGKCDGVIECADRMGAAFRETAELPAILRPQAG